jgi:hypothetical protein
MESNAIYSTMIRAGKATYFVDVREAKNGQRFLSISETRIEGETRKRTTLRIFGESIEPFKLAITEAAGAVTAQ